METNQETKEPKQSNTQKISQTHTQMLRENKTEEKNQHNIINFLRSKPSPQEATGSRPESRSPAEFSNSIF